MLTSYYTTYYYPSMSDYPHYPTYLKQLYPKDIPIPDVEKGEAMSVANQVKTHYANKDDRQQFIRWYLDEYGYNTVKISAEKLSKAYSKNNRGKQIPKITIHRWVKGLKDADITQYTSMYLIEHIQ